MKKIKINIRGEIVPFMLLFPVWLFFMGFLGLQHFRVSDMNDSETAGRNAMRNAVREESYEDAFNFIEDYLEKEGIELTNSDPEYHLNIYYLNTDTEAYELASSNDSSIYWETGNILQLEFRTKSFFNRGVNEVCFIGDNCINILRDTSPIRIRAIIE